MISLNSRSICSLQEYFALMCHSFVKPRRNKNFFFLCLSHLLFFILNASKSWRDDRFAQYIFACCVHWPYLNKTHFHVRMSDYTFIIVQAAPILDMQTTSLCPFTQPTDTNWHRQTLSQNNLNAGPQKLIVSCRTVVHWQTGMCLKL